MTKSQLIELLSARHSQLAPKDAELAVKTMLDAMALTLASGNRIEIRGFGSFGLNYLPPRTGRNPKTGARVEVPAKKIPYFKPSKELKDVVNSSALAAAPGDKYSYRQLDDFTDLIQRSLQRVPEVAKVQRVGVRREPGLRQRPLHALDGLQPRVQASRE